MASGPEPSDLVDPVSAEQLQREMLTTMHEWALWARELPWSRWKQPYLVLSYCRLLYTLRSGTVTSKGAAAEWALGALDTQWASLVQRALDDRPDPWLRVHEPADPEAIDRTLAFIDYALNEAVTSSASIGFR
jgi:hypothetical protein